MRALPPRQARLAPAPLPAIRPTDFCPGRTGASSRQARHPAGTRQSPARPRGTAQQYSAAPQDSSTLGLERNAGRSRALAIWVKPCLKKNTKKKIAEPGPETNIESQNALEPDQNRLASDNCGQIPPDSRACRRRRPARIPGLDHSPIDRGKTLEFRREELRRGPRLDRLRAESRSMATSGPPTGLGPRRATHAPSTAIRPGQCRHLVVQRDQMAQQDRPPPGHLARRIRRFTYLIPRL